MGNTLRAMDRGVESANSVVNYLFLYLVPTIVECLVVIGVFLLHYKSAALALLVFVKCVPSPDPPSLPCVLNVFPSEVALPDRLRRHVRVEGVCIVNRSPWAAHTNRGVHNSNARVCLASAGSRLSTPGEAGDEPGPTLTPTPTLALGRV